MGSPPPSTPRSPRKLGFPILESTCPEFNFDRPSSKFVTCAQSGGVFTPDVYAPPTIVERLQAGCATTSNNSIYGNYDSSSRSYQSIQDASLMQRSAVSASSPPPPLEWKNGLGKYIDLPPSKRQVLGTILGLDGQSESLAHEVIPGGVTLKPLEDCLNDYPFQSLLDAAWRDGILGVEDIGVVPQIWLEDSEEDEQGQAPDALGRGEGVQGAVLSSIYSHLKAIGNAAITTSTVHIGTTSEYYTTPAAVFLQTAKQKNMAFCASTETNLFRLRHAGGCDGTDSGNAGVGACKHEWCGRTRELWRHLQTCSELHCGYSRCITSSWEVRTTIVSDCTIPCRTVFVAMQLTSRVQK